MNDLRGRVAVVTGASRGVGRGIALGLGEAGATVYLTGRTWAPGSAPLPGSLQETAEEVTRLGGKGIPVRVDHARDDEVEALFRRVEEAGGLDLLVNNAFAIPDGPLFGTEFWKQPLSFWDAMHQVGLRSHYVASVFAAPLMVAKRSGLIVNVSSAGGGGYAVNVAYGVGKAGVDRLARDMAHELKPHGVASVSIWPGLVRTERLLAPGTKHPFDMSRSESPLFTGRAVAALARDPQVMAKTGKVLVTAELGEEYGFTDADGSRPRPLRPPRS